MIVLTSLIFLSLWLTGRAMPSGGAGTTAADSLTPEERGFRNLSQRPYGVPNLTPQVFANLWKVWEPAWKDRVNAEDPEQIRRVAFERYGLSEAPYSNGGVPMQFVETEKGWVPTCMQCHGGRIPGSGKSMVGIPNTEIDLALLAEDVTKSFGMHRDMSRLGTTRGRTNAFVFSIELFARRNPDLSTRSAPVDMGPYRNADLDAIPWWHIRKKTRLYTDGTVTGDFVRPIMQFTLAGTAGETIRSWEPEFRDVLAYLKSIEPPKYPWPIDSSLAAEGRRIFERTCSVCHGTYGPDGKYPNRVVPIEEVQTDPLRLTGITKEFRAYYNETWFGEHARAEPESRGYIAPPLDGVWASAPYFHNGAVPTVHAVLSPASRPRYWRRVGTPTGYDTKDLGFEIDVLSGPASPDATAEQRRRVIDTTQPGLGNQGHPFGTVLSDEEIRKVIEYLKTL